MSLQAPRVAEYLDILGEHDTGAAVRFATGLVDGGMRVSDVLLDVIAPAQREIGERWHRNEISVAEEHAATAVTDTVVSVLTGMNPVAADGASVVVVCAEGEWHTLPARLMAEALAARGHQVTYLGPSMPATHLERFLSQLAPDVLAVSCSTPLALEGVLSCVLVAHSVGVHVAAGGRGLGPDEMRAVVLGADYWAPDAATLDERLRRRHRTTLREPVAYTATVMELSLSRDDVVAAAMTELARRFPPFAHFDQAQRARTREDLTYILQFAEATILVADEALFDEFLDWLGTLLDARGLPPGTLDVTLQALSAAVTHPALVTLMEIARSSRR